MKKFSTFLTGIILVAFSFTSSAQGIVDPATAWFNQENFEGVDYTVAGWKNVSNDADATVVKIMPLSDASTSASATGKVLAATAATGETFTHGSSAVNVYKTFTASLTGMVYVNTSFWLSTRVNHYAFCDDEGNEVFRFGGLNNQSNNAFTCTDKPADFTMGNRNSWGDLEFILDLSTNKIIKMKGAYNTSAPEASNVALSTVHKGNIATLKLLTETGYYLNGLDNTTIGELIADAIGEISGNGTFQTLGGTTVNQIYSVEAIANAMDIAVVVPAKTRTNIVWTISDYNGLSASDVTITRSETDYASATLTTSDAVTSDVTIKIKATFETYEKEFEVTLKSANADALKVELLSEINTASALTLPGSNPYLTSVEADLTAAIATAQGVYDNPSADPVAIQAAIDALQAAESTFQAGVAVYNTFESYIADVLNVKDAETRDAAFFTAIKATLQDAIDVAIAALSTVDSETAIEAATETLGTALNTFNAGIPYYTNLDAAITTAGARYDIIAERIGSKFLNFTQADSDNFHAALEAAQTALLINATTIEDLSDAKTALENAMTTINSKRNAPGVETYRIYSYGDGINSPSTKKMMYVEVGSDGDGNETYALKSIEVENITEDFKNEIANADQWKIAANAANQYTIQNAATGRYLKVTGTTVSADAVTLSLPETNAGNNVISVDPGYLFYAIVEGANYLRQRSATEENPPYFQTYSSDLKRYDTSFQFEEVGSTTQIKNNTISPDATVVSEVYFDLTGKITDAHIKGIIIKKTTYSDGSVVAEKIMNQ